MTVWRFVLRGNAAVVTLDAHDEAIAARLYADAAAAEQFVPMRSRDPHRRLDGWRAQVGVARLFGLDPATITHEADDGIDLQAGERSVQVRFNPYPQGDLYAPSWSTFRADLLVLVRPGLLVGGWVPREVFEAQAHVLSWATDDGRRRGMTPAELWPLELLPIASSA